MLACRTPGDSQHFSNATAMSHTSSIPGRVGPAAAPDPQSGPLPANAFQLESRLFAALVSHYVIRAPQPRPLTYRFAVLAGAWLFLSPKLPQGDPLERAGVSIAVATMVGWMNAVYAQRHRPEDRQHACQALGVPLGKPYMAKGSWLGLTKYGPTFSTVSLRSEIGYDPGWHRRMRGLCRGPGERDWRPRWRRVARTCLGGAWGCVRVVRVRAQRKPAERGAAACPPQPQVQCLSFS